MKKFICSAIALLVLFGCSSAIEEPDTPQVENRKITISGVLTPNSKSSLSSEGNVLWSVGDKISIVYNGKPYTFTSTNQEPAATADFEGYIPVPSNTDISSLQLYGVYGSAVYEESNGRWSVNLVDKQNAVEGTFANYTSIAAGVASNLSIQFSNVCGLVEFTLQRDDVKEVYLTGNKGEVLAGDLFLSFDSNGIPSISSIANGLSTLSLEKKNGECFTSGEKYYYVLPPTKFTEGFSLSFVDTDGNVWVKNIDDKSVEIKRSVISYLENADEGAELQDGNKDIVTFGCENLKNYCVANFDKNGDGEISKEEALLVTTISISTNYIEGEDQMSKIISSLSGLEHFVNLESLHLSVSAGDYVWWGNAEGLKEVNLNANTRLKSVYIIGYCNIETVVVDKCVELESLSISSSLRKRQGDDYYTSKGKLKSLDVSKNTKLHKLSVNGCDLQGTVDISMLSELELLQCAGNGNMTELKLGNHNNLYRINAHTCRSLTTLNLAGCPDLKELTLYDASDELQLNLSANTKLEKLLIDSYKRTAFPSLDLEFLKIFGMSNAVEEDVVTYKFPNLEDLVVKHFKTLDLSGVPNLKLLGISSTHATEVDLSKCLNLECVESESWSTIPTLDISNNSKLTSFTSGGAEALKTLYVGVGQEIEGVTVNRSDSQIHPNTEIVQKGGISTEGFEREAI